MESIKFIASQAKSIHLYKSLIVLLNYIEDTL